MKHLFGLSALFILTSGLTIQAQLHGFTIDAENGEAISGVTVKNNNTLISSVSNNYGYFSIGVSGTHLVKFTAVGYNDLLIAVDSVDWKYPFKVNLVKKINQLAEVSVNTDNNKLNEDGKIHLTSQVIKQIPMLLGEKDPLKALQFMPGIQEISEGSSSLSVRGGDADQNLLVLDEAVVYNANHLFGFFSTFNVDPIKSVDAYKSFFPAQFGGRLSSVIDVRLREGNKQKFAVEGGVGLISSRLMVEGPISKGRSSFLLAGRRTYADLFILPFQSSREKTGYYFGDLNAKIHLIGDSKNEFFLSAYTGKDNFYQKNKIPRREDYLLNNVSLTWGNITVTGRWNKVYSQKLFHNLSLIYTNYAMQYKENTTQNYLNPPRFEDIKLNSGNKDISVKLDYDYFLEDHLQLKFGGTIMKHFFEPRQFSYLTSRTFDGFQNNAESIQDYEGAVYSNLTGSKRKLFYQAGLRLSYFENPVYFSPEPRVLIGLNISKNKTTSISYSRMNQYLHLISNTGNGLPTDVWIPSTENLKRSSADMFNFSFNTKPAKGIDLLVEAYYKIIRGNVAYKSGVNFLGIGQGASAAPFNWENSLLQGRSWNYGYEFSLRRSEGKLTGFASYSLSWSIAKFDELNEGKAFYTKQDRRHILETTLMYSPKKRLSFSSNFIFATGNALSVPDGVFFREDRGNNYLEIYNGVNGFRAGNYHRLDLALLLKGRKLKNSWEFSIYNVYNRKNPFSYSTKNNISLVSRTQEVNVVRQWLIPVLPSVTYNFKF